jgi:hypothetical protein
MSLPAWIEYAETVAYWDDLVETNPNPETYRARWQARLRHPSWAEKREAFLWYTGNRCEGCNTLQKPDDLQLHHWHYNTLWYENNEDLELLCPTCHRRADKEREANTSTIPMTAPERAIAYMEAANRFSGQTDWPVTYQQALDAVTDDRYWENQ